MEEALALAGVIADNAPLAVRWSKQVMVRRRRACPDDEGWKLNAEAVGGGVLLGRRHGGPRRLRREAQAQLAGQVTRAAD